MSLARRLAMVMAIAFAMLTTASAFTGAWLARTSLYDSVDGLLDDQASQLSERAARLRALESLNLSFPERPDAPDAGLGRVSEANIRLQVVDPELQVVFGTPALPIDADIIEQARQGEPVRQIVSIDGRPFRTLSVRYEDSDMVVQLASSTESIEAGLADLQRGLLWTGIIGIIITSALGAIFARRFLAPIADVTAATKMLASHDELPEPLAVTRSDEVGQLAASFNQLTEALASARAERQLLVADVSHELRTPLTSLRMKIDFLDAEHDLPDAQRQTVLSTAAAELESLSELVEELVAVASELPTDDDPEQVRLDLEVQRCVEHARERNGREIRLQTSPMELVLRPAMARRAITNLIENAVKFSDQPIEVHQSGAFVEVLDRGPGIAEVDKARVFERFYRAPSNHQLPGTGIGLALVAQAAEAHGGVYWANDRAGGGSAIGLSFGRATNSAKRPRPDQRSVDREDSAAQATPSSPGQ